jgi:HAD superfamily hydrolase (TIGR01509 family)
MTRPEAVLFDLGKVLIDFDYGIAARRIASRGTRTAQEVQGFIDHSPLLFRYETGAIDRHRFFEEIRKISGFRGDIEEFARYFADVFSPIEAMIQLHAQLRTRNIPTFIFSNTNDIAIAHIRRKFPFFAGFDAYVFSYEHGAMKPDPRLYEVAERIAGRQGSQILYLDDRLENVEGGRARGWQVIHHHSPAASIEQVRKMGFLG